MVERPAIRNADVQEIIITGRRPVVDLTFALNAAIDPDSPVSYHLFNMLIHIAAGVVLYDLVRRAIRLSPWRERLEGRQTAFAFAIALLWMVHPLNTQAVSYMIQRYESLAGLFYLLTMWAVLRHAQAPQRWVWAAVAVAACALGMASKEILVSAPIMALLLDRTLIAGSFGRALKHRWPMYLGLALTWALLPLMGLTDLMGENQSAGLGMKLLTPTSYLLSQGEVILHYLRLSFWPHPLVLDYVWFPAYPEGPWLWTSAVVAALLVVALVGLWRNTWWGLLGAWFFLVLGPTSSVAPIADLAMEHRMYLPLIAVVALVVFLVDAALRRLPEPQLRRLLQLGLLTAAGAALALMTVARNFEYRTAVGLWETVVERMPHNPRGYYNLGNAYEEAGYYQEALETFERTTQLLPPGAGMRSRAFSSMGAVYADLGYVDDALPHFRQALKDDPENPEAHYNLGGILMLKGDLEQARRALETAIDFRPEYVSALNNLGVTLAKLGEREQAIQRFEQALEIDPKFADAHTNLGALLLDLDQPAAAATHLEAAQRLGEPSPMVNANLGRAYAALGRMDEAVRTLEEAASRWPESVSAHQTLAGVYLRAGDPARAVRALERGLAANPGSPELTLQLAMLLTTQSDPAMRDPARAVTLLRPLEPLARENIEVAAAMAVAHAATGDLAQAVHWQRQAVAVAEQSGASPGVVTSMRQMLSAWQRQLDEQKEKPTQ